MFDPGKAGEGLLKLLANIQVSLIETLSSLNPEAFLESFLMPRIETIYFVFLGFACAAVTLAIICVAKYYLAPLQYGTEQLRSSPQNSL